MKPLIAFPARVTENTGPAAGTGGRLVLHCDDAQVQAGDALLQVELIVNARTDAPLEQFPASKIAFPAGGPYAGSIEARRFGVLVVEIDPATGRALAPIPAEPFAVPQPAESV